MSMLSGQLKKFLIENEGAFSVGMWAANDWLKENKQPFELGYDEDTKTFSIKLVEVKK
jgi:hypothetical protein